MGKAVGRVGAVLVAVLAVITAGCDWAQVGYGPGRTSYNPVETGLTPETIAGMTRAWTKGDLLNRMSAPVAADGRAFVTLGGDVIAFDLATGAELWRHELYTDSDVFPAPSLEVRRAGLGSPAVVGGRVYVPYHHADPVCDDVACTSLLAGGVATFEADDGTPVTGTPWQTGVPSDSVLVGAQGGHVVATTADFEGGSFARGSEVVIHQADGDARWTLASDVPPALDEPRSHVLTAVGTRVRAHALGCAGTRCVRAWSYDTGGTVAGVVSDGRSVYATTTAGAVVVLDAATGEVRWTAQTPGPVASAPAVAAGVVYVAGGDTLSVVPACDAPTCAPAWSAQVDGTLQVQPVVAGRLVYVSELTPYEPYPYPLDGTRGLVYARDGCGAATCSPLATTPVQPGRPRESLVVDGTYVLGGEVVSQGMRLP